MSKKPIWISEGCTISVSNEIPETFDEAGFEKLYFVNVGHKIDHQESTSEVDLIASISQDEPLTREQIDILRWLIDECRPLFEMKKWRGRNKSDRKRNRSNRWR